MRSTESQRMATSAELLRSSNFCLKSTVQELRLEIAYYQGEAKRLEWEKNVLKQDLGKMSALFKGWLDLLQCSNSRSIVDETEYFKNLVKNPTKNISEILQMNDLKLLVTTCQAPFFIEHTNKAWSLECGWDSHEVLGLSCAFLQGEATHLKTAATFTKNIKEFGYANMRINNYRKNGSLFNVSVTSFPIYDSLAVNGVSSDVPILTHFATILSDIRDLTSEDMETEVSDSVTQVIEGYIMPRATHEAAPTAVPTPVSVFSSSTTATSFPFSSSSPSHSSSSMNTSAFSSIHPTTSSFLHSVDAPSSSSASSSSSSTGRFYDRRARSTRFEAECQMTSEDFLVTVATIRLSDLLRLMLSCKDAMVLTDKRGRIVHCNGAWVELTGHTLTDAEGLDCDILHGSMTDSSEIRRCNGLRRAFQASVSTVVNYRKDGLMFLNSVTTSPIRGIYMSEDVSHYCALLIPQPPQYSLNDTFNLNLGYACSSSSGTCSGYGSKRDRSCKSKSLSDSEDDDNDNNTDDYSSDMGATMDMKKVRNNIFLDRQAICSDSEIECHPRNRDRDRGQYYTHENTTQLNNNDNSSSSSSSDTLNILSDNNTSSSEHRISSSSQSRTSSSSGSSLRSSLSLSSRSFQREVHSFSEKPCAHLNILHTAKNSSKHLRIDSKIVSSNDNSSDSNSVNDQSSSSGTDTNVDSPITDGNDSP